MSAPGSIATGRELWIPAFEVRLRDRPLDQAVVHDVLEVTYRDSLDDVDAFDLTLNNWDAGTRSFKFSDGDLFEPGKEIELSMGYRDDPELQRMLVGEITSLTPAFPASGGSTVKVGGLNVLHRLRKRQESWAYENKTDDEIATQVAARLGVPIDVDPTEGQRYDYVAQDNRFDVVFLLERARRIGYDLFVDETTGSLRFTPSDRVTRIAYRLTYGATLVSFDPTLSTARQVAKVTVHGWDAVQKKAITATADRSELRTSGVGDAGGQAEIDHAYGDREEVIADRPVHTEDEAKTLARETLERIAKELVTARGTTVGLPELRTGSVVHLDGLGTRFSGRYFVTSSAHTIGGSGYTTAFECRREEL